MTARPTLAAPIKVAEWWKNRGGESIRLDLATFEGRNIVSLRTWFTQDGVLRPGKGFACEVRHLPRLTAAFAKALAKARELGLVDADEQHAAPLLDMHHRNGDRS